MNKAWKWIGVGLVTMAALGGAALAIAPPVDIRPDGLKARGLTPEAKRRGRALLAKLPERYGGLAAYRAKGHTEVRLVDRWPNALMRAMACPWKQGESLRLTFANLSDNSRLQFQGGARDGEAWGIQQWVTYTQSAQGERSFADDDTIRFWLPTIEYFVELPFRIGEATVVAHVGEAKLNGAVQDLVFVSWGKAEPQGDVDQYVVWINRETGLVDYTQYTVREMGKLMQGGMRYEDHRDVDGILIPFRMTAGDPEGQDTLHRFELKEARFVANPEPSLVPEPARRRRK